MTETATAAPSWSPAPWLGTDTPALVRGIVLRALADVLLLEMPPGSNRSPMIDGYVRRAGGRPGDYWCAGAQFCWWEDAGAATPPPGPAMGCDEWMRWAKRNGFWRATPGLGYAVVYGTKDPLDAHHIGTVVRILGGHAFSVEGNTSLSGFSRNGIGVFPKYVEPARVLGYIAPVPRT